MKQSNGIVALPAEEGFPPFSKCMDCEEAFETSAKDKHVCPDTFERDLRRLEAKFTPAVLHALVRKVLESCIEHARKVRAKEYERMDEMRAKGVPYSERIKSLNTKRIELCDRIEEKYGRDLHVFVATPLRSWVTPEDIWWARRHGMVSAARMRLSIPLGAQEVIYSVHKSY